MFPNIKRTRSQIMNDMKYIYVKNSEKYFINDKVQSSSVRCSLKEIKEPIPTQQLLAKHDVNIKENAHNSIYIDICNKQIQDVRTISYFFNEMLYF
jgi:biopolymer transport protein ExbD